MANDRDHEQAKEYRISVAAARAFLAAVGADMEPPAWRPRRELPAEEIVARYAAGEPAYKVAQAYGCSPAAVRARVVAAGVPVRGPSEANRLRATRGRG